MSHFHKQIASLQVQLDAERAESNRLRDQLRQSQKIVEMRERQLNASEVQRKALEDVIKTGKVL